MLKRYWVPTVLATALLAACGGGGGGGGSGKGTETPAGVQLSGYAAKGALANALVEVHAVRSGNIDPAVAAQTTSASDGSYTVPRFAPEPGVQYVIVVKAKADGSTSHIDEVTGQVQTLPGGFEMRAFLPSDNPNARISVTPFSELAVAAAEDEGFTPDSVAQANSNVAQLIGFDPRFVQPMTLEAAAAAPDTAGKTQQQLLAVLLTAVSQMAKDGALGCAEADAGKQADCVVEKLAEGYGVDNTKPAGATALSDAIQTVVAANPTLVSPAVADTVVGSLSPSNPGTPATPAQGEAIAATKALLTDLRTNVITLLGSGADGGTRGAVRQQADLFEAHVDTLEDATKMLAKDADALLIAANLFDKYKSGQSTAVTVSNAEGEYQQEGPGNPYAVSCGLATDNNGNVLVAPGTTPDPATINSVGCSVRYHVVVGTYNGAPAAEEYRHGFAVIPTATPGAFTYATRARKSVYQNGTRVANDPFSATGYTGTLTLARDGQGDYNSATIQGELDVTFKSQSGSRGALANEGGKSSWSIQATRSLSGARETLALQGDFVTYNQDASVKSALSVKPGTAVALEAGQPVEGAVSVTATAATAQFEGSFSMANSALDASGGVRLPMDVQLSGSFRNAPEAGAAFAEFAGGTVSLKIDPASWAAYDASQADSAGNQFSATLGFAGKVTAPQRPALALDLNVSTQSFDPRASAQLTGQYRTLASDGTPMRVLAIQGTEAQGLTISEATSGISLALKTDDSRSAITRNGVTVGEIDHGTHIVTFTNGDFVSFDFGL